MNKILRHTTTNHGHAEAGDGGAGFRWYEINQKKQWINQATAIAAGLYWL
jgi:hypothetical protein